MRKLEDQFRKSYTQIKFQEESTEIIGEVFSFFKETVQENFPEITKFLDYMRASWMHSTKANKTLIPKGILTEFQKLVNK